MKCAFSNWYCQILRYGSGKDIYQFKKPYACAVKPLVWPVDTEGKCWSYRSLNVLGFSVMACGKSDREGGIRKCLYADGRLGKKNSLNYHQAEAVFNSKLTLILQQQPHWFFFIQLSMFLNLWKLILWKWFGLVMVTLWTILTDYGMLDYVIPYNKNGQKLLNSQMVKWFSSQTKKDISMPVDSITSIVEHVY